MLEGSQRPEGSQRRVAVAPAVVAVASKQQHAPTRIRKHVPPAKTVALQVSSSRSDAGEDDTEDDEADDASDANDAKEEQRQTAGDADSTAAGTAGGLGVLSFLSTRASTKKATSAYTDTTVVSTNNLEDQPALVALSGPSESTEGSANVAAPP